MRSARLDLAREARAVGVPTPVWLPAAATGRPSEAVPARDKICTSQTSEPKQGSDSGRKGNGVKGLSDAHLESLPSDLLQLGQLGLQGRLHRCRNFAALANAGRGCSWGIHGIRVFGGGTAPVSRLSFPCLSLGSKQLKTPQ